jgi:4-amino-4-deoxy-L-arabinose transferase-like glycosyltransferase
MNILKALENSPIKILTIICSLIFLLELLAIYNSPFIGNSDQTIYAEMANCIIKGKISQVNFVRSYFHKKYDTLPQFEKGLGIFYPLLIVPFMLFLGKIALAVKLPSLIMGNFGIPIMTYFICREIKFEKYVSAIISILVSIHRYIICISLWGVADTTFTFLILVLILCIFRLNKSKLYSFLTGVIFGITYLTKTAASLILLGLILSVLILHKRKIIKISLTNVLLFLVGMSIIIPWLIRNYLIFQNPFFDSHLDHVWIVGLPNYTDYLWRLWWYKSPPSFNEVIEKWGRIILFKRFLINMFGNLCGLFLGIKFPGVFLGIKSFFEGNIIKNLLHIIYALVLGIPAIIGIVMIFQKRNHMILFPIVGLPYLIIPSFLGRIEYPRMVLFFYPILFIIAGYAIMNKALQKFIKYFLFIFLIMSIGYFFIELYRFHLDPFNETDLLKVGYWLKHHTSSENVIMTDFPEQLCFYSDRKTILLPHPSTKEEIYEVIKHYNAKYLVYNFNKIKNPMPELNMIHKEGELGVFEFK